MHLKKLKILFTRHLLIITVLFPLIIIIFYGVSISLALKYKHHIYTQQELHRYELSKSSKINILIFLKRKPNILTPL